MKKIFLLSGKAQSGKDSAAIIMKEYLENRNERVIILHYADFLKFFCKQYLGWDGQKDANGRQMLQKWGTDIVRKNHQDIWVNMMIELIKGIGTEYDYIIIPDVRFLNELSKIITEFCSCEPRVVTIRITRPNFDNGLTEEQKNHVSETALDDYCDCAFQYFWNNDGTEEEYHKKIGRFLKTLLKK